MNESFVRRLVLNGLVPAGIVERSDASSALTSSLDDWKNTLNVNVLGVIHVLQQFVPQMQAQDADSIVVNTSSYAGLINASRIGFGSGLPYAASKHAVTLISENLAQELRSSAGCRVTAHLLCPAAVATGIVDNASTAAVSELPETERSAAKEQLRKQPGSWGIVQSGISGAQMVDVLYEGLVNDKFYILGYDNSRGGSKESMKALIQVSIASA
jgi:NAD(P)-dependent dehydrogenase (short-subunit alcohol dehydrogenase family)